MTPVLLLALALMLVALIAALALGNALLTASQAVDELELENTLLKKELENTRMACGLPPRRVLRASPPEKKPYSDWGLK